MRVRGIPAALVAITAALTSTVALQHHHSYPQARPQTVDTAAVVPVSPVEDDLLYLKRASRSRPVEPKPTAKPTPRVTSKNLPINVGSVVKPALRSQPTHKALVRTYEHASVPRGTGSYAWAHTRSAIEVANCESGDRHGSNTSYNGNAHMRDGKYHGKWQMDSDFWSTYGGHQYASDAADASESEQDAVAYRGYQARGWQPWECASIMGVR